MSPRRFADLDDAGRQLAAAVVTTYGGREDVIVLGVEPHGLVVARHVGAALDADVLGLAVDGPVPDAVTGSTVLVVDDGVEGGGTAERFARHLRPAGPARLVLAVPVCPREPFAALSRVYDEIVALERPLMVRSLTWHYSSFPGKPFPGSESAQVP